MKGFLAFLGIIGRFYRALLVGLTDDLLVLVRLKWRPPSGPARWRWRAAPRPRRPQSRTLLPRRPGPPPIYPCGCSNLKVEIDECDHYEPGAMP